MEHESCQSSRHRTGVAEKLTFKLSTLSFLVSTRPARLLREPRPDLRLCTESSARAESMLARLPDLRFRLPFAAPSWEASLVASSSISSKWSSAAEAMSGDDATCLHEQGEPGLRGLSVGSMRLEEMCRRRTARCPRHQINGMTQME